MAKNGHRILYTSTYVCNILWLCFCSFKRPLFQLCLEIILSHLLFLEASLNQFCFYIDNLSGLGKPNPKPILRRFRVDSLALERVPRCSSIAIPFCSTLSNTSHMVLGVPPFGAAKFSNLLLCSIAENSFLIRPFREARPSQGAVKDLRHLLKAFRVSVTEWRNDCSGQELLQAYPT